MSINMKLIISIIHYLKEQVKKEQNPDTAESLEVAIQCLQTAYDLDPHDARLLRNELPLSLEEIFASALPGDEEKEGATGGTVNKAEIMKDLGNNLMRAEQFSDAIRHYTAAINLDNNNAVYYCNRAAAYSKLNDFQNAVKDCKKAVEIDPKYAKAFGRMGLAFTSLGQNQLAVEAFQKAIELEPTNESYQGNLKIALGKKEKPSNTAPGLSSLSSVDWQSLFSNPAFRNMASTIMQDPNIISALSTGMSQSLGGAPINNPPVSESASGTAPNPNSDNSSNGARSLDLLLEAGQYLAAQMQAANPDLVEQFRQTTRNTNPSNPDNKDSS